MGGTRVNNTDSWIDTWRLNVEVLIFIITKIRVASVGPKSHEQSHGQEYRLIT
jgi:hypothetical protein